MKPTSPTITVRNLPPEVSRAIRDRARRRKTSLSQAAGELLAEATGATRRQEPILNRDFEEFAGTWTEEEAAEFDAFLAEHRKIDPEDWK